MWLRDVDSTRLVLMEAGSLSGTEINWPSSHSSLSGV